MGGTAAAASVLFGASLLGAVLWFVYGQYLRRQPRSIAVVRLRRSYRIGLPIWYLGTLFALTASEWLGVGTQIVETIGLGDTLPGALLDLAVTFTTPAVAVVAAYLGAVPAIQDIREIELNYGTAAVRASRYILGLVLATLVIWVSLLWLLSGSGFVAFAGVSLAAIYAVSPLLVRLLVSTRAPTADERERLDRDSNAVGLDVDQVRVVTAMDGTAPQAYVRGIWPYRTVFVTEPLLNVGDDHLRAALAVRAGRQRTHHFETRLFVTIAGVGGSTALLLGSVSVTGTDDTLLAATVALVTIAALWIGRRLVFRADAYASEHVGSDILADWIYRATDEADVPLQRGRIWSLARMEPDPATRLDRLATRRTETED